MKFAAIIALTALLISPVAGQAQEKQPATVDGAWKITIETPMGGINADLTIKLDGDKFTGELTSERGTLALTGTLEKESIKFWGEVNGFVLSFEGKPGATEMSGTVDFGGNGGGNWSAKRS
jgi:hypothetical protein